MKTFAGSLLALAASLSLVAALPSAGLQKPRRTACPEGVEVTLIGAEPSNPADQYSVWVSFSEPTYPGYDADINPQLTALSISSVVYDHTVASCTFVGVDSGKAVADEVVEANGGQLGPPQTITEVSCTCICD